ncbi:hypothetical protein BCR42DRAFT_414923 [Absidia repens]|uniref:BZIP domain-containing protein n=1 Tax=Absidia repens TaxID=90262 RepID=A0A1X2IGV6_9FUNG|nr:hypothetical protein BCR42DRAFT_414923 [Absidia repens]
MKHEFGKPMSLSYVMTAPAYGENHHHSNSYPTTPDLSPLNPSLGPSSPQSFDSLSGTFSPSATTTTTADNYDFHPSYNHHPHHDHHHRHRKQKKSSSSVTSDEDGEDDLLGGSGLTLLERRQRNKTASAKYRQKKNRQQIEMKRMIDNLTEQDALLKRQMAELRTENQKLKSMNDHLRGKILAKKMLDQYFERRQHRQQQPSESKNDSPTDHDMDDIESLDSF